MVHIPKTTTKPKIVLCIHQQTRTFRSNRKFMYTDVIKICCVLFCGHGEIHQNSVHFWRGDNGMYFCVICIDFNKLFVGKRPAIALANPHCPFFKSDPIYDHTPLFPPLFLLLWSLVHSCHFCKKCYSS